MNPKGRRILKIAGTFTAVLLIVLLATVYFLNYFPGETEMMEIVGRQEGPALQMGKSIKILCWNIQYLAGKDYVFFYDLIDGSGPDERPSAESIKRTLAEVVRVIEDENPDIILLQEVDDGSKRSDKQNQLALILDRISTEYAYHSSAFYHKSRFVPHPRIMGPVGMKLSTISKYKILSSIRHQLALKPDNWLKKQFDLKRAVLETRIEVENGESLSLFNTHLSAFSQGTDTLEKQVKRIEQLLKQRSEAGIRWVIGGDFNLLAAKEAYERLGRYEKQYYNPQTELTILSGKYPMVPALTEIQSLNPRWFTHFPNNPQINAPDRTIDYFFIDPKLKIAAARVRQKDTLHISDHLPIIVSITIDNH